MSLTQLVRSLFLSTALATAPAAYSCGGDETSKACVSDTECNGDDRICVDGKCEYGGGKDDSGSGEDGPCGNSPLNGKYLWDIGSCQGGSISPGDLASCTLEYAMAAMGVDGPTEMPNLEGARVYKYFGNTIHFGIEGVNDYTLSREFSCSSAHPEDQPLCSSVQCTFRKDSGFYLLIPLPPNDNGPLRLKSNLWKIDTTNIWETPANYCPYGDPVIADCFSAGDLDF